MLETEEADMIVHLIAKKMGIQWTKENGYGEMRMKQNYPESTDMVMNLLGKRKVNEGHGKSVCPKCDGEGCEHCDGKGYHINEMPNRANMEKINTLIKKHSGKFKWRDEVLYVEKGIEKDVVSLIKKGGLTATVKVSSNPMREDVELEEAVLAGRDYKYDGKVVKISKKNFSKVHKDFKNSTKGKERMLINDPKTGGSISVPVQFEEIELAEKGTAYPATIKTLKMIVKDKQHQTVMFDKGSAMVDLFSASAMVQVYDALKPATKKKFEDMIKSKEGFMKSQAFAFSMAKK